MNTFEFDILWYQSSSYLIESIQFGILIGLFLSFPFSPSFLFTFREYLVDKELGLRCFRGTLCASFACLFIFLFGSSSFLKFWYYLEPFISLIGLFLLFRLATCLDASPNRFLGFISFDFPWFSKIQKNIFSFQSSHTFSIIPFRKETKKENMNENYEKKEPEVETKFQSLGETFLFQNGLFFFNFKPSPTQKSFQKDFFWLSFFLVFTNPFLFAPFGSLVYGIQFHDPFFRILLLIVALGVFSLCTFLLLFFFNQVVPPLFFGEVNRFSFFVDTLVACLLSLTVLFPIAQMSWREAFWRSSDFFLKNETSQIFQKTKVLENEPFQKDDPDFSHFQYVSEYQSPTFQEPMIQYNRSRPWYDLEPLTPYQFEYGVRKYRLSTARLFGQKYLSFFSSQVRDQESFPKSISLSFFLQSFYNRLPYVKAQAVFQNHQKLDNQETLSSGDFSFQNQKRYSFQLSDEKLEKEREKLSQNSSEFLSQKQISQQEKQNPLYFSFSSQNDQVGESEISKELRSERSFRLKGQSENPLELGILNSNVKKIRDFSHQNIGFENGTEDQKKTVNLRSETLLHDFPSSFFPWFSKKINSEEKFSQKDNLKGYPQFSYVRLLPLTSDQSAKLRSEMYEYTKLLQN